MKIQTVQEIISGIPEEPKLFTDSQEAEKHILAIAKENDWDGEGSYLNAIEFFSEDDNYNIYYWELTLDE